MEKGPDRLAAGFGPTPCGSYDSSDVCRPAATDGEMTAIIIVHFRPPFCLDFFFVRIRSAYGEDSNGTSSR